MATPLQSPPPPTGITTRARSGTSSRSSSPSVPWPASHVGVVERVHEREPVRARPLLGRSGTHSSTGGAADVDDRALGRAPPPSWRSGHRRGRRPRSARPGCARPRPAPARGCRPTAPTTPAAQPSSPRAVSFARRAADLEGTSALQVLGLQRDDGRPRARRTCGWRGWGSRRAVVATPARAARTSSAVTGEDSTVATSVRLSLARGTPWGMKALGTPETLLPQRRHARRVPALGDAHAAPAVGRHRRPRAARVRPRGGRGPCDLRSPPRSDRPGRPRTPAASSSRWRTGSRSSTSRPATLEPLAEFPHGREDMRANDGDVDPAGRFWIGTLCEDEAPDRAALYRYDPDGTLTPVLQPVSLSNGLAWATGEQRMYYVDTPTKRVDVLDYDAATGEVSNRRPFALIEDGGGVSTALRIDVEDGVWVALYGGAQVRRYGPGGTLDAGPPPPGRQRHRLQRSAARTGAACSSPPRAPAAARRQPVHRRAGHRRPAGPGVRRHDHDHRRRRARHPLPHLARARRVRRDEPRPGLLGRLRRAAAPTTASRATG